MQRTRQFNIRRIRDIDDKVADDLVAIEEPLEIRVGFRGADGRDEAEGLLERRSGNEDHPRILEAFNRLEES